MRRLRFSLLLALFSITCYAPSAYYKVDTTPKVEQKSDLDRLWKAVCLQESGNNPFAINEKEQAYGIAQIRQIRLDDYAKLTGKRYTLEDCFNPTVAKEIFMYYATTFFPENDLCLIARRWNGSGPMTWDYWDGVQHYLVV